MAIFVYSKDTYKYSYWAAAASSVCVIDTATVYGRSIYNTAQTFDNHP